jgi:hypothetical protein
VEALLHSSRVETDWNKMMDILLRLIENDATIPIGRNYIQELYIYLYLFGLRIVPIFCQPLSRAGPASKSFSAWRNIPSIACITLKVSKGQTWSLHKSEDDEAWYTYCSLHLTISPKIYWPAMAKHILYRTTGFWGDHYIGIKIRRGFQSWRCRR